MQSLPNKSVGLEVELGDRSYPIYIAEGLISNVGEHIHATRCIIISDENVAPLYAADVVESCQAAGIQTDLIILPAGEGTKSFDSYQGLMERLLELQPDRKTALIALGGGVIGDLTGFAASTLLRGVPFVQVPTSLLAQVDSSVGGKTAINCAAGKNLIGAFYQPQAVIIDVKTLETLPPREVDAGYAEVVKYGLIDDADFYNWLDEHAAAMQAKEVEALTYAITESCAAKARIVAEDEREQGKRALLNLGHTFGHALEKQTGYSDKLLHGEAVAIGMLMAADLSIRLGYCDASVKTELLEHYAKIGLRTSLDDVRDESWDAETLTSYCYADKKAENGTLTFVLLVSIGEAFVARDVPHDTVNAVFSEYISKGAL